ncbi:MAG TPA: hypothetical protein VEP30_06375, partial [Chthoniobacterales bacterium]|nr:hypothetical protein [Chthoniobacterales bacterium]
NGSGDPIVLYDHLADRWIISQFAGVNYPTDECVAVSTSSDATGTYYRYGFHLGSNFVDYPKLGVWPDAYYMTMNIFDSSGSTFLGPKPYAFDRASMLTGAPAIVISTGRLASTEYSLLPADLDGSTLPPAGAPNSFLEFPGQSTPKYKIYHFHVDFITPANSTFINFASPLAAGFNAVCASSCVPQAGTSSLLDALGDRLMFRLAYRNFGDHESLLANYSVKHNAVAGVRWVELRNVTAGPVSVFQESTYQPDSTWRWMGSAAMDKRGNLVIGYSASSASISPQIRYAGRLATDPVNTLSQGEAHLFDGGGSQTPGTRWGDYTAMSIDPIDDTTFWYTNEYYSVTSDFNWRTRIGSFRFPGIISAVSRKLHGSAGTFDLDLPVTGTRGVECRSGGSGGNYQIILTSANNLTAVGNVSVSCGSVSSSSIGPNPNQYTVNLTGENSCDGQYLTINLTGVADSSGAVFNASQTFGLLLGDTTANGVVNSSDIAQTQSQSGQTVTAFNFREDVTVNGIINSSDIALVQSESGTGLPTPP